MSNESVSKTVLRIIRARHKCELYTTVPIFLIITETINY